MRNLKSDTLISFRLSKILVKQIDEFAKMLELPNLPVMKYGGCQSLAIRLCIEDTINRYMGPKDDPDELVSPYYNEMSKILPILKNIKLREKLEELIDTKEFNEVVGIKSSDKKQKELIDKVMKKYS